MGVLILLLLPLLLLLLLLLLPPPPQAYDRAALVAQLETLNSQLVSAAQAGEGVEADNRRLIQVQGCRCCCCCW
jgi:hypothetical protein